MNPNGTPACTNTLNWRRRSSFECAPKTSAISKIPCETVICRKEVDFHSLQIAQSAEHATDNRDVYLVLCHLPPQECSNPLPVIAWLMQLSSVRRHHRSPAECSNRKGMSQGW